MGQAVEDEGVARDHEEAIRYLGTRFAPNIGKPLPEPCSIVSQITHRAAREGREVSLARPGPRSHEVAHRSEGVLGLEAALSVLVVPANLSAFDAEARYRFDPEEGPSPEASASCRFKEIGSLQGIECVDGRKTVGSDVLDDRNDRTALGGLEEIALGRADHRPSFNVTV
jgi:hypothetical protein